MEGDREWESGSNGGGGKSMRGGEERMGYPRGWELEEN